MFLDLINLNKLRRAILYALLLFLVMTIQNSVFGRVRILGVAPMFIPVVVAAVGMHEGGVWGAVFGLAAGYFTDRSFDNLLLFTVMFPLIGFFSGMLVDNFLNRSFAAYLLMSFVALVIAAGGQALKLWIGVGALPLATLPVAGLQVLWSLPFAVPAYFLCRGLSARRLA